MCDGIMTKFKLIQALIVVLIVCKNEEDPFKIESTRMVTYFLGLARLIEISVNRSIYKRKTIIDMKIQKSVTFNVCSVYLFN